VDPALYRTSRVEGPALRVGLLLDGPVLPRWAADVLRQIADSDFARVSFVVYNASGAAQEAPGVLTAIERRLPAFLRTLWRTLREPVRRRQFLYSLYQRWDRRQVAAADDPIVPVDCSTLLNGIPSIAVAPVTSRFVHRFPDEDLARIRAANLDVILRFGFNILRGGILQAARCGVWSYHHGDNDRYRGGPAYFWEIYERSPTSGVVLQMLTEDLDAGVILCKGQFATAHTVSHARNRVGPYWGASTFVIQTLKAVHERGWDAVRTAAQPSGAYRGRRKIYRAPTNWEMARWIVPRLGAAAARRIRPRRTVPHWRLAVRTSPPYALERGDISSLDGFQWLNPRPGTYHADPFLTETRGGRWLFFEEYDYAAKRGRLACAEMDGRGAPGRVVPVLDRPYHLSYPCLVHDAGELFMIPETCDNGTVELYRCRRFPDDWQLEAELFRGHAVDTTVWIEDGRYWFFVTLVEPRGHGAQLWLFRADSLTGAWRPHPASPLSTDARVSRGAGAIFRSHGRLIRPSQDCSGNYGQSFTLNEIVTLDDERYEERPAVTVGPIPGLLGIHTYGRLDGLEVIDGCTRLARP
jgi:hypothetical protein